MSEHSDCQKGFLENSDELQSKHAEANLGAQQSPDYLDADQAVSVSHELDSQLYTASSTALSSPLKTTRTHPLTVDWAFGINSNLPVFCLQDGERLVILYVCAHVAVIYDHTSNTQHLLQGHCSPISCVCVSEDCRWLVTADKGQDSLVIVWDTYTGIPVRTLFDCHPEGGTVSLALSHDSKHLVSVGAAERQQQRVCIWDWTSESESPLCVTELSEEFGTQRHILFNPNDNTQLVSTSESRVLFYTMEGATLQYSAPEITDKTFHKALGVFTHSLFHSGGAQAFSATSLGNLLIWAQRTEGRGTDSSYAALKLVPLQEDAITVLTQIDRFIVTGDSRGHVKFYDSSLKLISHYSDFKLDSISSLSFGTKLPSGPLGHPRDCTLPARPFVIQNLVISTETAIVVHVTSQGGVVQTLLKEHADSLQAVACHPRQPVVAMGSNSGILKVWNYEQRGLVCSRLFQRDPHIQCLAYDPYGVYLAVGFANGVVCVLDACSLHSEDVDSFTYSSDSITHIAFSHDSHYLAAADEGKAVTLFRLCSEEGSQRWHYQGRHHSHYMPIQDLLFGEQLDTGLPRLLSLGEDRRLVEYDLQASGDDRLVIMSAERIEQSGMPTCMSWYPPLTTEHFLLTASHLYKMKLYNSTTKMCRKTLRGPCFGSPVKKMMMLPQSSDGDPNARYMAYITADKVGLQILPLDGNPHRCSAQLCHPMGVSDMAVSHEGRYVFTAGGADCTAFCWDISLSALEAAAALGGKDLEPFYSLLEGGRDGELFREMEDYFYYSQLRSQGLDSMQTRQVSTHIPLAEVPFVMRALGFYPTEQELEDIQNEVKFSRYAETGQYVTHVDLPEFIRLFVNHRPALGLRLHELRWALSVLGESDGPGHARIPRDRLIELLQARGEHMTEEELVECFSTLLGVSPEGGRSEAGSTRRQDTETLLETKIPAEITLETFVEGILGFPLSNQEASISCSDISSLLPPKDADEVQSEEN